jgi:CheY-like chemotaxis protein
MDGYSAMRQLRQDNYDRPIIALKAHAMADERRKCITAGCDDYATKPIDRNRLIELVRTDANATLENETDVVGQA